LTASQRSPGPPGSAPSIARAAPIYSAERFCLDQGSLDRQPLATTTRRGTEHQKRAPHWPRSASDRRLRTFLRAVTNAGPIFSSFNAGRQPAVQALVVQRLTPGQTTTPSTPTTTPAVKIDESHPFLKLGDAGAGVRKLPANASTSWAPIHHSRSPGRFTDETNEAVLAFQRQSFADERTNGTESWPPIPGGRSTTDYRPRRSTPRGSRRSPCRRGHRPTEQPGVRPRRRSLVQTTTIAAPTPKGTRRLRGGLCRSQSFHAERALAWRVKPGPARRLPLQSWMRGLTIASATRRCGQ